MNYQPFSPLVFFRIAVIPTMATIPKAIRTATAILAGSETLDMRATSPSVLSLLSTKPGIGVQVPYEHS